MSTPFRSVLAGLLALFALGLPPAAANDSQAEWALGGLVLRPSEAIRLDSQDLFISRDRVRVTYRFTNTTGTDIDILVAFPLPDFRLGVTEFPPDYAGELDFRTTVDGRPLALELVQRAMFRGRDISDQLTGFGLPVVPADIEAFSKRVNAMKGDVRDGLVRDGLLIDGGGEGAAKEWYAAWTVTTSVTRRQTFPAGRTVQVEHSYKPFVGGSVGGRLDRRERRTADFRDAARKFCIEDGFLPGLDRRLATNRQRNRDASYGEAWIGYRLTPGANWAGPIRSFRLVVDKGQPQSLVSFCARGVTKISPTQFEVRYQNYEPREDLNVLIVDFD
jgi:hypothetical protein